ncbi:MmgE/PrpD family protein [Bosea sp. (in: a-proteobacteria)]|uniref:MmgE/PrpD family protein n=1 Tax=Bosea sp. (in: a-proteobacteria) TaxID=1871050 RepID=UPI002633F55E|nr:MmgE/PrpD family protein [Bosea sp. (in: a-proteobacteria)]MCO5089846.1 MmgE/PrpD family protein [Bosea sp. (in: a-proteobacteria)]
MQTQDDTLATRLARWSTGTRYEDLPPAVLHQTRRAVLDYLGCTLRGADTPLAAAVRSYLDTADRGGEAAVIGTDRSLSPAGAAFANATAASVLELDDGHGQATIHPGATCISAVLAAAGAHGASDADIVVAITLAYELSSRLGIALCPAAGERGFHCSPAIGVLGAAFGASRTFGSDVRTTAHALGLAGSNAGGLFDYHGGWLDAWSINAGRATREGLLCASLAGHGVAGPLDIFEGPKGFGLAFAGPGFDAAGIGRGLGRDWLLLGTAVKIHPCCRRLHSVIDALLSLEDGSAVDPFAIDRIVVETTAESARLDRRRFENAAIAKMSIPYGAAATLVYGSPTLDHFEDEARRDPRIRHLVERVEVRTSDDPTISDPLGFAARVAVTAGGATRDATVITPIGDPARPVDDAMLIDKFRTLADPVIGSEAAREIVAATFALGEAGDNGKLVRLLGGKAR